MLYIPRIEISDQRRDWPKWGVLKLAPNTGNILMMQQDAIVAFNNPVGRDSWHMGLNATRSFKNATPGQFVMLQIPSNGSVFLRRPFSIFGLLKNREHICGVELLYKVVGRGTKVMSTLQVDQRVNLIGPLGHGFQVSAALNRVYLVAGGIGVAPIRFLSVYLKDRVSALGDCRVFLGGRTEDELLCRQDFESLGFSITLTTDDGSAGDQCFITDPLADALQAQKPDAVYACGPDGMLRCVAGLCERHQVPCQMSMEASMACGIGACLGCALKPKNVDAPYFHVCKDGPVFIASSLALTE